MATEIETTQLPAEVLALVDRAQINELIDRYVATIDDCFQLDHSPFDDAWSRSLFTEDVTVEFPVGDHRGIAGLAELHAGVMAKWESTLHFSTNRLIAIDGDRATVRATLLGTHMHRPEDPGKPLFAAHVLEAEALRGDAGWRFQRFVFRLVWRIGDPPAGLTPKEG